MTDPRTNPFLVSGPALISFSGGRTSGFMLHEILRAHGGNLPENVHVTFANTGKEREETLRFVHECGSRWNVAAHWLEWRDGSFEEVGYNSASRKGEPFDGIIAKKQYLPNPLTRFCTIELKIRVMRNFAISLGWKNWANIVGLRYDEGPRVLKALARNDSGKERFKVVMPLSKGKITLRDVSDFWKSQDFDLNLFPHEGNCDLCFLKGKNKLRHIIRSNPKLADWWIGHEAERHAPFRKYGEPSYENLRKDVLSQGYFDFGDDEEHDVECGLLCVGDVE